MLLGPPKQSCCFIQLRTHQKNRALRLLLRGIEPRTSRLLNGCYTIKLQERDIVVFRSEETCLYVSKSPIHEEAGGPRKHTKRWWRALHFAATTARLRPRFLEEIIVLIWVKKHVTIYPIWVEV